MIIKRLEILRIGVRQKELEVDKDRALIHNLLYYSSSDDEIFAIEDAPTQSRAWELDAKTVVVETLKIRNPIGIQSLCEAAWTSIFNYGIEFFTREQRDLMQHIARCSSARECTVSCIVGDKDILRHKEIYITAIACTPLMLLRDIENKSTEVYTGLYPTAVIPLDAFLDSELRRYVKECPRHVSAGFFGPIMLNIRVRYPNAHLFTWGKRMSERHRVVYFR